MLKNNSFSSRGGKVAHHARKYADCGLCAYVVGWFLNMLANMRGQKKGAGMLMFGFVFVSVSMHIHTSYTHTHTHGLETKGFCCWLMDALHGKYIPNAREQTLGTQHTQALEQHISRDPNNYNSFYVYMRMCVWMRVCINTPAPVRNRLD